MVKLFCLSVFGRRTKVAKSILVSEMEQSSKGINDSLEAKSALNDKKKQGITALETSLQLDGTIGDSYQADDLVVGKKPSMNMNPPAAEALTGVGDSSEMDLLNHFNAVEVAEVAVVTECAHYSPNAGKKEVGELVSGSHDESHGLLQHSEKVDSDSQGECADESGSEVSDVDSNKQLSEDYAKPLDVDIYKNVQCDEYFGTPDQCVFVATVNPEIVSDILIGKQVPEIGGGTGYAIGADSPGSVMFSINDGRIALSDDILAGHLSDPGVYTTNGLSVESPALLGDRCILPSEMNGSSFSQNLESQSNGAVSPPSGDALEKLSVETGKHGSEPAYHVTELVQNGTESNHYNRTGYSSDGGKLGHHRHSISGGHQVKVLTTLEGSEGEVEESAPATGLNLEAVKVSGWMSSPPAESARTRVEKWISNIQQLDESLDGSEFAAHGFDVTTEKEREDEVLAGENSGVVPLQQGTDIISMDRALANAAIRSLNVSSTVAHITGLGLTEVPSLGSFSALKTLDLSANRIVRIPAGCLPRSLHSLDLSRNRISVIEGFRDLTRLRVLNLSYNRIARIGHGLANCTLIKELYLAGNKIAEVEGLHRLLKLSVLDLSYNKLATSKALGQLAANYNSLLALNLLGNPVLMNLGEEQMRKMVLSLTPHVTYLNKQPIKAVSVREAVIDSVARAALGTSQRNTKSGSAKASRRASGAQSVSSHKKLPNHHRKEAEKRGVAPSDHDLSSSSRLSKHHHHHHHHHHRRHANDGQQSKNGSGKETSKHPMILREKLLRNLALDSGPQAIHRSRSESALQE